MKRLKHGVIILQLLAATVAGAATAAAAEKSADKAPVADSLGEPNRGPTGMLAEQYRNFAKNFISRKNERAPEAKVQPHVAMGPDLKALRDDFNAKAGTVRLLFIVGPNCGRCLYGMEKIDEALIRENSDARLNTFVIYVPTLGATEEDVAPATRFLTGRNVNHYWEDTGIIGSHYQKVLELGKYCWDTWMVYGPEARWDKVMPPKPDYWIRIMSDPVQFSKIVRDQLSKL